MPSATTHDAQLRIQTARQGFLRGATRTYLKALREALVEWITEIDTRIAMLPQEEPK